MSAAELGRRIGSGEIDPLLLTETFLDAIWEHDLQDQIYARLTDDRAVSEASAASKRARRMGSVCRCLTVFPSVGRISLTRLMSEQKLGRDC